MAGIARALSVVAPRSLKLLLAKNDNLTPRRLFNVILNKVEMKLGRTHLVSRPYELCIDVSNKCNLSCPFCPTGRHEIGRGKGHVTYETFAGILDELAPYALTLELFNWGEAFFNPELPRLIAFATRKRLATLMSSNLSFRLKEDYIRSVIASGLTYMTASVDGADQQSYEVYRRGGKFDLVIENLRTFVRLKREMNSEFPRICWQYLIFAHNEERVDEARRLAQEIGLDTFSAMGGLYEDPSWAPKGDYSFAYLDMRANRCAWLWKKAVFHWDGGMASCCMGFYKHDDFADWTPGTFGQMWNNAKFIAARRIWTEKDSPLPEGHFCTDCDKVRFYRGMPLHSKMKLPPELRELEAS
ncbi:MAG: radical SAM protein [Deltaproteobacteria bacterium]|nr:radical SAM protein [Deltaproteobacteria bacterium]MBI3390795.1 radical SAM protein [Deltaproteobacteria bacterium]